MAVLRGPRAGGSWIHYLQQPRRHACAPWACSWATASCHATWILDTCHVAAAVARRAWTPQQQQLGVPGPISSSSWVCLDPAGGHAWTHQQLQVGAPGSIISSSWACLDPSAAAAGRAWIHQQQQVGVPGPISSSGWACLDPSAAAGGHAWTHQQQQVGVSGSKFLDPCPQGRPGKHGRP